MSQFSFPKSERLAKRPQFEEVMAKGRRTRVSSICTLFMMVNGLGRKRLGIIASKKIGNAVIRNRAKRKIREAFRRIKDRIDPGMDIVVISGKDLVPLSVCTLEEKLSKPLLNQQ
jgi:ribonuclease P protein component